MRFIVAELSILEAGLRECPHAVAAAAVLEGVDGRPEGLTGEEARRRRMAVPERKRHGRGAAVLEEVAESLIEPLQLLLISVGVLSAIFGQVRDAVAIFVIIGLVAAVEGVSEARAGKALDALRSLTTPSARVRRPGTVDTVAARDVVVGDVLVLEAGDVLLGDCRVLAASGLLADESALTGEPVGAGKSVDSVESAAPLAERSSMVYAGTAILGGTGLAVVVAVGGATELGRLGKLAAEAQEPPTPLQRSMSELARAALILAVTASVLVPLLGIARGQPVKQMLLAGLTLAFATIPEELPILVTVLVAVGGVRLARRGVLLRRLRAAEAIGAITVVLTDKTGTLTENHLVLARVLGDRARVVDVALAAHAGERSRDPLDLALGEADQPTEGRQPCVLTAGFAFDPVRKRESAAWHERERVRVCAKGAPEAIVAVCAMTDADRAAALAGARDLAEQGLRVIAVAERRGGPVPRDVGEGERQLEYVGLAGFEDSLRRGVPDAVRALADAGVRTLVVTGDHPLTAAAVARQAGLRDPQVLLGGPELARLSDATLSEHLLRELVVARATPADKLRLVRLLQAQGESVAVTGDGVNDAPALSGADVGIAMGRRGTELAREAADLILTDDAYPTVVAAVHGGRGIGDQLRRAVAFYLGAKLALVATIATPLALGLASPFKPVHIVLLELFMDLGASVAFVCEPAAPTAMTRPPRNPAARFLDRVEVTAIALTALTLTAATLPAFLLVRTLAGPGAGSAAAVAAWLCAHAAIAWALRSEPRLALRVNPAFPVWALAATITALLLALTPLGHAVGLRSLDLPGLAIVAGASSVGALLAAAGQRVLHLPARL